MLQKKLWCGYRVCSLNSVEDLHGVDLSSTDMVFFPEKQEAGLYISNSIRWLGSLEDCVSWREFVDSSSVVKDIVKGEDFIIRQGYSIRVESLTLELAETFIELYEREVVATKGDRLVEVNVEAQTKDKVNSSGGAYLIGVYEGERLRAGLVFYLRGKEALVTLGAKERYKKVKGGFGGVIEKHLIDWCIHHDIATISHGRGTNPAGLMAKAGVFEFKARYGYSAYPEGEWKTMLILNKSIVEQDLVFVTVNNEGLAYIVLTQGSEKDAVHKYQTKNVHKVSVFNGEQHVLESIAWLSGQKNRLGIKHA